MDTAMMKIIEFGFTEIEEMDNLGDFRARVLRV